MKIDSLSSVAKKITFVLCMIICVILGFCDEGFRKSGIGVHAFAETKVAADKATDTNTVETTEEIHELGLSTNKITFTKSDYTGTKYAYSPNENLSVKSSNEKVVTANVFVYEKNKSEIIINAQKTGKAVLTVTNESGASEKINVTVKSSWEKLYVKNYTYLYVYYRQKTAYVSGLPGTTVTFKIGNKKYSAKIGQKRNKKIKLKSSPKFNSKIKFTAKRGKIKISNTYTVKSTTTGYMGQIWSCKKYIPINLYSIKKGDKVWITVGGKTYKKKIKKSAKSTTVTFTTKKYNSNYSSIRIRIYDKHKIKIYDSTRSITWNS